ncbi:MAG: hypothetical protein KF832_00700 [Caldilineaceae bacterium]|nr:hypothetical protein [Caldilineaceae bacterium]
MTKKSIPEWLMAPFSQRIVAQLGLNFPPERWRDLERCMHGAARDFGFDRLEPCIHWLLSAPFSRQQIEILATHLTIGESYFWRDHPLFDLLAHEILPALIQQRRANRCLRFWSAGCSTGEEAYSLAILLSQLLPDLADWQITILATDINPRALQRAAAGSYSDWSFRDVAPGFRERYFTKTTNGRFALVPEIKRLVTFAYLNLAEDHDPTLPDNIGAMDMIFCRNVFLYFAPEVIARVLPKLHGTLAEGGWLVMNPSEVDPSVLAALAFDTVAFTGVIIYRRNRTVARKPSATVLTSQPESDADTALTTLSGLQPLAPGPAAQAIAPLPIAPAYEAACRAYEQGRYAEVIMIALPALQSQPDSKFAALLAHAYANVGELSAALAWCEQSLVADKLDPLLHYLRATILQEHGRLDEAMKALQQAIYLDQGFILAHFTLGHLAWQQADPVVAAKHWRNVLALLTNYCPTALIPEAGGLTASGLQEIIHVLLASEASL